MSLQTIEVSRTSTATPNAIFALLSEPTRWPTWSPISASAIETPSPHGSGGVGEVRRLCTGRITSRERVVASETPHHFAYVLLSGLALRDYRADVRVRPTATGSEITWRSTFGAKIPLAGALYRNQLEKFIVQIVDGLAAHAALVAA